MMPKVRHAHSARILAAAGLALAVAAVALPALAAPLLIVDGDDKTVVVLDLGSRERTGDVREASIYHGAIAEAGQPRRLTGERRAFDCPARRERIVATLTRRDGAAPLRTPVEGPWTPISWKSPMDYGYTAVCLNIFDRDRVSTQPDVPSMLEALERVWQPGQYQPPTKLEAAPSGRSWWRPF